MQHVLGADPGDPDALLAHAELLHAIQPGQRSCGALRHAAAAFGARGRADEALAAAGRAADACALAAAAAPDQPGAAHGGSGTIAAGGFDCDAAAADAGAQLAAGGAAAVLGRALVRSAGVPCRARSHAYLAAVHALQAADPHDPGLHVEWAQLLLGAAPPRTAEARTHLAVAAILFDKAGEPGEAAAARALVPQQEGEQEL